MQFIYPKPAKVRINNKAKLARLARRLAERLRRKKR